MVLPQESSHGETKQLRPPCRQVYFASVGAVCKVHLQECCCQMVRGIESALKRGQQLRRQSLPLIAPKTRPGTCCLSPGFDAADEERGQAASASPHAAYLLSKRMPRSSPSIVIGNIRLFINCRITEIDWR